MRKLILLIMVGTTGVLAFMGYQQYSENQRMVLAHEQERITYQQEKKALDRARSSNDPVEINAFIQQHPDSVWLDIAHYHHDRLVVQNAIDAKDTTKLKQFIHHKQHSQWRQHAEHYLKKFSRERNVELAKKKNLQTETPAELTIRKTPLPAQKKTSQAKKIKKASSDDARDRVNRALAIYKKMDNQKQIQLRQQKKQQQNDQKRSRNCNRMKDQLIQYTKRIRWYELDGQGNRVFLKKEEVNKRKQAAQNDYDKYCL